MAWFGMGFGYDHSATDCLCIQINNNVVSVTDLWGNNPSATPITDTI